MSFAGEGEKRILTKDEVWQFILRAANRCEDYSSSYEKFINSTDINNLRITISYSAPGHTFPFHAEVEDFQHFSNLVVQAANQLIDILDANINSIIEH